MIGDNVIAMWSGPRNISTAMMRSFGSRQDTFVSDEPLYGNFLFRTGIDHPMKDEVILSQETSWNSLTSYLTGGVPGGYAVWYQKHMTHHYPDNYSMEWISLFKNCFLIRDPASVIVSYLKIFDIENADLLGFRKQKEIFDYVYRLSGVIPVVVDAHDIIKDPKKMIEKICIRLGIPFLDTMLSWERGAREYDGVWTKFWYKNVNKTTGFTRTSNRVLDVPKKYIEIYNECLEYYNYLYQYRIK